MDYICSGVDTGKNIVGEYGHGNVFAGTGNRKHLIGVYKNGTIYVHDGRGGNLEIGTYVNGMAFQQGNPAQACGSCEKGNIYKGIKVVGTYTGDEDGAAVTAMLLGLLKDSKDSKE